jgi:hypothetical protein
VVTALRPPTVAGVGGGVGTTSLAVALRGHDGGTARTDTADIVVCRGTLDSLHRAAEVLDRVRSGPRPVLAVTLDGARLPRGPLRAQLAVLEARASGVVLLPRVHHWRVLADPLPEIASLLVDPPQRLPGALRAYTVALRQLAAAVAASGRLEVAPGGRRRPTDPPRPEVAARPPRVGQPPVVRAGTAAPPRTPAPARTATGPQAVPVGREERRPAPPVLASARPVAAPVRAPVTAVAVPPGDAGREAPPPRRRGVRIVTAPPVERVG